MSSTTYCLRTRLQSSSSWSSWMKHILWMCYTGMIQQPCRTSWLFQVGSLTTPCNLIVPGELAEDRIHTETSCTCQFVFFKPILDKCVTGRRALFLVRYTQPHEWPICLFKHILLVGMHCFLFAILILLSDLFLLTCQWHCKQAIKRSRYADQFVHYMKII